MKSISYKSPTLIMYLVFCILNTVCIHVWGYIENSILIIYQRSTKT